MKFEIGDILITKNVMTLQSSLSPTKSVPKGSRCVINHIGAIGESIIFYRVVYDNSEYFVYVNDLTDFYTIAEYRKLIIEDLL